MKQKLNKIKRTKKFMLILVVLMINVLIVASNIYAVELNEASVYKVSDCGTLLIYNGVTVKVSYIEYNKNGVAYPAYCMNKTKPGAETGSYNVDIQSTLQDVRLWRIIINGYPYKTCEELGVANKEEAFTATKQAVYVYLHGNDINKYEPVGEAGIRTLNALKKIVNDANTSNETKISSTLTINRVSTKWERDEIEKDYVSKIYEVVAGANMQSYKITLNNNEEDLGGIKLTDENNNEKNEFYPNEKFKVLVPIKSMQEKGKVEIKAESKVKTKPVLFGATLKPGTQDYALITEMYEDGTGNISDEYTKNETKIIILKKDQDSGKMLEGVEFELLNQDKNIVYTDLKTDKDGKIVIENLVPGVYYLRETKSIDGYDRYSEIIKIELDLNQEMTITVNNKKEEKPKVESKKETSKEVSTKEIKKLPVAGM